MPPSAEEILELLLAWKLLHPREAALWRHRLRRELRWRRPDLFLKQLVRCGKLTSFQAATIKQGKAENLRVGDYVLVDRLGVGAMGRVYKAVERSRKRWVALKVLRHEWTESPRHVERFQREVRAARRLRHPHIVRALGAGSDRGTHYLAMEFVDGPNLEKFLRTHGPLPIALAVRLTMQAAKGLAYAHARGVVHRDIKPSNLLVDPDGSLKILDMGIARLLSAEDEQRCERLTHSGQLLGTPHYMAPEQALDPKNASPQCDIYALGCTLYRMLTGEMPYTGESDFDILLAHLRSPVPSAAAVRQDVPDKLDAICRRMMAKNAEHRYASLQAVIGDLDLAHFEDATDAQAAPATVANASLDVETRTDVGAPAADSAAFEPAVVERKRRLRWRADDDDQATVEAPVEPLPESPAPRGPSTQSALRALSPPQAERLRWERESPRRFVSRHPRGRLRKSAPFWCACAASAVAILGGLALAARIDRGGSVSLEVHPGEALVEIFDASENLELRRVTGEKLIFHAAPGPYLLKVTKRGFAPYVREFSVESGRRGAMLAILQRR